MLTIDKERDYQRKLDNLWKKYDALKEQLAKFQRCEIPPVRLYDLICAMGCHIGAAIKHYKNILEDSTIDEHKRKCTEGFLNSAIETKECLDWLNGLRCEGKVENGK